VPPGPEEWTKWKVKPEQLIRKAKHLEVNASERNLYEVLPARFVRPELALVTVTADFLEDPRNSTAFLAFIRGHQFPHRLGDYGGWKHIRGAILTSVRRKPVGFTQKAQTQ
jgi:hypothetical protein